MILFMLILGIISGGRSSLLAILIFLGMFLFYFDLTKKYAKRINLWGILGLISALLVAAFVSSKYSQGDTIQDGITMVVNRVAAVADGLEYYMKYDGYENIKSGLHAYFLSIFGIYLHILGGFEYKNVGTQLTELVIGNVSYAQGANYTFLLQIMVIGYYVFIIYTPLIAYFAMKLRYNIPNQLKRLPLSYFLSSSCFLIVTDIEYGILVLVSGILFYILFLYPVLNFNFKNR